VHVHNKPGGVLLNDEALTEYQTLEALQQAADGWFFDPAEKLGTVHVKTQALPLNNSFNVKLTATTSVREDQFVNKIRVFPNPATGIVKVSADDSITEVSVYDFSGKKISGHKGFKKADNSIEMDLSQEPAGNYYIEVKTRDYSSSHKITLVK
jgi:hypothetical protein